MASPENQLCADCISKLSFPMIDSQLSSHTAANAVLQDAVWGGLVGPTNHVLNGARPQCEGIYLFLKVPTSIWLIKEQIAAS